MKKTIELFLRENKYLPLSIWKHFKLKHGDKTVLKESIKTMGEKVGKRKGLYVYKKGGKTLYVGEGKLLDRISSHYRESLNSTDIKQGETWHKFFSTKKHKGWVSIYWKEEDREENRKVLESMLEYVLKPAFPPFKKDFLKKKEIDWNGKPSRK